MSYILDAIKKSEAERNLGVSPGALAAPMLASRSTTSFRIATVIVVLNVSALGGWWLWQDRTTGMVLPTAAAPALSQERVDPSPPMAKPIPTPQPKPPAALPEFSTHVFADDPQLRAVTLDGRRLTEGQLIGPGMRLLEITESGVVLDYYGERIEFDVLQDWRS
jgi:hypothetical protein